MDTTGNFDIGFTGDAGGHFDKSDFVAFDDVNALLCLRFFTTRRCG